MIVMFETAPTLGVQKEFNPGPMAQLDNKPFMTAWIAMADKAGLNLGLAAEKRYELIQDLIKTEDDPAGRLQLKKEMETIQDGPTPVPGAPGSDERREWFKKSAEKWEAALDDPGAGGGGDQRAELMRQILSNPSQASRLFTGGVGGGQPDKPIRKVRVTTLEELKESVVAHPALQWDERMEDMAGAEGEVYKDDTDETSHVRFPELGVTAWLSTSTLREI